MNNAEQTFSKKSNLQKLRFSNYWKMLFISFIPWIVTYIVLQVEANRRNYDSLLDINDDLDNFLWILLGGLFFTSMGMTSTSYYASNYTTSLDKLAPLINKTTNDTKRDKELSDKNSVNNHEINKWYKDFIDDVNSKRWIGIYVLPFIIIGSILHYIIYGNLVVDEFEWSFYLITLAVLLWTNIFMITWIGWFVLAQYYHIYKFTIDSEDKQLRIGVHNDENSWFNRILVKILPRNTVPRNIKVDIFNVDGLGGLNPLAQLSLSGTLLTGVVLAVIVPVIIVANSTAALFLVPISFFVIIAGYVIGISSLRDAIRTEKNIQLSKINTNLTKLADKLIEQSDSDLEGAKIEELQILNEKFTILETLGNKINDIPESPTSLKAFVRIGSSSVLPLISFISVDQIGLFL